MRRIRALSLAVAATAASTVAATAACGGSGFAEIGAAPLYRIEARDSSVLGGWATLAGPLQGDYTAIINGHFPPRPVGVWTRQVHFLHPALPSADLTRAAMICELRFTSALEGEALTLSSDGMTCETLAEAAAGFAVSCARDWDPDLPGYVLRLSVSEG